MANNNANDVKSTAQKYLDIYDITNDLLILRDGGVSLLLRVNAINFGLLSEPEQDAIIYAYAALINSLSFPIQITIKSQPKDVSRYLEYVEEQLQFAKTDLRRRQIAQYRQFVANLITEQNVLDKTFYVVLPVSGLELGITDSLNPFRSLGNGQDPQFDKYALMEKAKNVLLPRRDHMISQFARIGLQAKQMTTKEIIQLFYVAYNAEAAEGVRVVDSKEYTTAAIQADEQSLPNQPNSQAAQVADQPMANNQTPTAQVASAQAVSNQTTPESSQPPATPAYGYDSTSDVSQVSLENLDSVPQESFTGNQAR